MKTIIFTALLLVAASWGQGLTTPPGTVRTFKSEDGQTELQVSCCTRSMLDNAMFVSNGTCKVLAATGGIDFDNFGRRLFEFYCEGGTEDGFTVYAEMLHDKPGCIKVFVLRSGRQPEAPSFVLCESE